LIKIKVVNIPMNRRKKRLRFFLPVLLISGITCISSVKAVQQKQPVILERIGSTIITLYSAGDTAGLLSLSDTLIKNLAVSISDSSELADIYYYTGVCKLLAERHKEALPWLHLSIDFKKKQGVIDDHYAKGIYNLGVAYNYLGEFDRVIDYMLQYIDIGTKLYGSYSPEIATAYSTVIGASLENKDYENFRKYTFLTLEILNSNKNIFTDDELSNLYINIGAGYARLYDYAKARIYFEEAESILNKGVVSNNQNYINLINNMAITYGKLVLTEKEAEYFERGIEMAEANDSYLAYNMINSYAIELGNAGKISSGVELLSALLVKAKAVFGTDSRFYAEVLKNYAEYLRIYIHDYQNSLNYYLLCLDYLDRHNDEVTLREPVITGYAMALSETGESQKALKKIQELLFSDVAPGVTPDLYENPDPDMLKADNRTLRIFKTKYDILWNLYEVSEEYEVLVSAASTSELVINLIERIRINISEEESRIILGDNYRRSYLNSIRDFELCFRSTGEQRFLEKAFEYAEKSKVAGLLAATRELNAVNFHIPQAIAELEHSLQREIGYYNSRISAENEKEKPQKEMLSEWNANLLEVIKKRDSLILTYERDYPEYYTLKYNTAVPSMEDVPSIIGHKGNYLNYIVSDSVLYILVVNRKHQHLTTVKIDSVFINRIMDFRKHLSNPDLSAHARKNFNSYQEVGYDLYKTLIEPVRKYFISPDLLISPDNMLSYLPYETLLTSTYDGEDIMYRKLPYLMNDFSVSYTYSVSFMQEAGNGIYGRAKNLVAFAPMYPGTLNVDSLFMKRQTGGKILDDLPYARQEAEYVARVSEGVLFLNDNARESVFKAEAGKYDIIHLAMHTYLNDKNPMNSAMIFMQNGDMPEDGLLNTYEVYGIPLKARMVVLSSCNTGSGSLSSGEGILSLARGFLYSGSQSVVMSMWEIEDRSGTEIIKLFYDNLLKGKSKSVSLKRARQAYLKNASQLKSHPYFWSSLVIYGDVSPVFSSRILTITAGCFVLILVIIMAYHLRYRKYS